MTSVPKDLGEKSKGDGRQHWKLCIIGWGEYK
jgi:hypothetical protein